MRKLPALIAVAALLTSLTACSTASAPGSQGCTAPASGNASDVVDASGAFGSKPKVTVPTPIVTKKTEVSTLIRGNGQTLTDGTPVLIKYTIYSGATGKEVTASSYGTPTTPITVGATKGGPLVDSLLCSTVGSRIAVAVKASELTDTTAKPNDKSGPAYVAVIDVVKAFLPKANGALQRGVNNMPAVVTAANGAPGVSIPDIAAPKEDKVQLVRRGGGHELTKNDTAIVQYTAVNWSKPSKVTGSTWTDGDAAAGLPLNSTQIPSEIRQGLIGQRVGSQVMIVVPATSSNGLTASAVYVFDVLGSL